MSNYSRVRRDCEQKNRLRRVVPGKVDHNTYFMNIEGDLLMSGKGAVDIGLLADMTECLAEKADMPTILLSGRLELFRELERRSLPGAVFAYPDRKNYHPFYGLSNPQIVRILKLAAEDLGYTELSSHLATYTFGVLNIVSRRYPVSYPALYQLLLHDDSYIAELGAQEGIPRAVQDAILGNCEAGHAVRRLLEYVENTFQDVASSDSETEVSLVSRVQERRTVTGLYQTSLNQKVFNASLTEELREIARSAACIRVIADDLAFGGGGNQDPLLELLFELKRRGAIELVLVSRNAVELLCGPKSEYKPDFENVILFRHSTDTAFNELSRLLFGEYEHWETTRSKAKPPALFFTFCHSEEWGSRMEERLRVRSLELGPQPGLLGGGAERLVVYTGNGMLYLVPVPAFLKTCEIPLLERRDTHV